MYEVSVVIPNYNGIQYIGHCLDSLRKQNMKDFQVIVVDNGSSDGSPEMISADYTEAKLIRLAENSGFCKAVNIGIRSAQTPFVILLNNDTEADPDFVGNLLKSIKKNKNRFSCQAKMLQYKDHDRIDDAGNFYSALGWAFARGKGRPSEKYRKEELIFASCAGAAIYRKSILDKIGLFDEEHFAYLEDLDIGYRARIYGYANVFEPKAVVYHVGSGTSGSRYNEFKIRYSSRNNVYLIYKNMPVLQVILNLPFLAAGFGIKILFFTWKGFGREYAAGIKNGLQLCNRNVKVKFHWKNMPNYLEIQRELWVNLVRRFTRK